MKQLLIAVLVLSCTLSRGQVDQIDFQQEPVVKAECTNFFVTPPLKELAKEEYKINPPLKRGKERKKREFLWNPNYTGEVPDPVHQTAKGADSDIELRVNISGATGGLPPDPSGAIGPNHYVQAVNTVWQVFGADGSSSSFPIGLSTLWDGSEDDGDPIVMYDQFVDRWFISQFQQEGNKILIAISVTPDPTEEFYAYEFSLNSFPDYPKFSVWGDAYCMTANSQGQDVVAFERDKMIAGDPSASMIALNAPNVPTGNFYSMLPADADGDLPPSGTPNYIFFPGDDSWFGNNSDHIRIYEMIIDWENPSNSGISLSQQLPTAAFNANFSASWDDIEQPNSNQRLDAIAGIFTYRAQYRRWINYNTVVLTMSVDVNGNNKAGVRWYELRQDDHAGVLGDWYVHQQGTFAPNDGNNRWLASACMDDHGNIGMAYSISGPNLSPSLACTGRLRWDPLGEMTKEEIIAIEGTGAQTEADGNRFGDYSQMTLAPDGETFWYTGEYIFGNVQRTRIFSFILNNALSVENEDESKLKKQLYQNGDLLHISVSNLPNNQQTQLDLFDVKGSQLSSELFSPNGTSIQKSINISHLPTGTYMVRFGNESYQFVERVFLEN